MSLKGNTEERNFLTVSTNGTVIVEPIGEAQAPYLKIMAEVLGAQGNGADKSSAQVFLGIGEEEE